jgi:hypothetical protein
MRQLYAFIDAIYMRRARDRYNLQVILAPFFQAKITKTFEELMGENSSDSQFDEKADKLLEERMQKAVEELGRNGKRK